MDTRYKMGNLSLSVWFLTKKINPYKTSPGFPLGKPLIVTHTEPVVNMTLLHFSLQDTEQQDLNEEQIQGM